MNRYLLFKGSDYYPNGGWVDPTTEQPHAKTITLESVILALNTDGWFLGSLCQMAPSDWYACVIDEEGFAHPGTGETPIDAILFAMQRPPMGRVYSRTAAILEDKDGKRVEPELNLQMLGLVQRETIRRRV